MERFLTSLIVSLVFSLVGVSIFKDVKPIDKKIPVELTKRQWDGVLQDVAAQGNTEDSLYLEIVKQIQNANHH